jgi:uncharacterized protein YbaR (Trm112 family)
MPLAAELVAILVCPKCKGALETREDQSAFTCKACRLVYQVTDGIPNFLIEEATALEGS